jgi:predicted ATP-grasp superfamily ATP-dependent carboligase
MNHIGAVILGNEYQALGHLRALKKNNVPCVLIDQDNFGPALFSKFKDRFFVSPHYTSTEFWPWLKQLAHKENLSKWIIIPTDDEQVRQLAEYYSEVVEIFTYKGLNWEQYQVIYNKRLAHPWAATLGIDNPKTVIPEDRQSITNHQLDFPFIVKPAVKREYKNHSKKKAIVVTSDEELSRTINRDLKEVPIDELLFQEIIPGDGKQQWSYAGFFVGGEPIAAYTACRLRQHPPDYGRASTYVVAIHDAQVEEVSKRILKELKYTGLAEVEWKKDLRDNKLKFLEVNARSWGWHSLSESVVGNIPLMYFNYLTAGKYKLIQPVYGKRWIKWITDIPVVFDLIKQNKLKIGEYIDSVNHNIVSCEWDKKDPKPMLLQFLLLPYLIFKRGY